MPKYMKDPRIKPPREKIVKEEPEIIKTHSKKKKDPIKKSNHKHEFGDDFILREKMKKDDSFSIDYICSRCKICGKLKRKKFLIFLTEDEILNLGLPIEVVDDVKGE